MLLVILTTEYRISRHDKEAALNSMRFYQGDRDGLQDELAVLLLESKGTEVDGSQGGVKVST